MKAFEDMDYHPCLDLRQTESAIKLIKDTFQNNIAEALHLQRVSAPLYVMPSSGLNDNLTGVERPVSFDVPAIPGEEAQIVHSLAKWKRLALKRYGFKPGEGLYTDMNAIRRDETLDALHSLYVDQWDWEKILEKKDRNEETLKETVRTIYAVVKKTAKKVLMAYPQLGHGFELPEEITFITAQELEDRYPASTAKEREDAFAREAKAYFLMKIGWPLRSGAPHDGRAPDYDDWNLNGDILLYHPLLDCAFEISSMGIRVDEDTLLRQLRASGCEERAKLHFHQELLAGRLPYTIGGGIGQSRLCMFMLGQIHIGQSHVSIWPEAMMNQMAGMGVELL